MSKSMLVKKLYSLAVVVTLIFHASFTYAGEITIELAEPSWTFLIQNSSHNPKLLKAGENSVVRTLQPLLKSKDYVAVSQALGEFSSQDESGAMLLLRGQIALALEDHKAAEQSLQQAVKKEPNLSGAHKGLALLYLAQKDYKHARNHLQFSIELGEHNAQIFGQLAYVNMQLGYAAAAVSGFQQAMFLESTNKEWQQGLLFSLVQSKAFSQASAQVEMMLDSDPLNQDLWLLRSQIALQSGDNLEALSSLESAILLGEKTPSNFMTAVQLHLTSGSPSRAIELLTSPTLLNKEMTTEHQQQLSQIANWLAADGQWDLLQSLLHRNKKQHVPEKLAGSLAVSEARLALHKGDKSIAERTLKRTLKQFPSHGEALIEYANLLKDQKRYTRATQYFTRAEALVDYREKALLGKANIAIYRNNYADALHLIGQIVTENPNRTDLESTISTLKNLVRNSI